MIFLVIREEKQVTLHVCCWIACLIILFNKESFQCLDLSNIHVHVVHVNYVHSVEVCVSNSLRCREREEDQAWKIEPLLLSPVVCQYLLYITKLNVP